MKKPGYSYTKKNVVELLGVKPYSVAFYADQGLVIPEIEDPKVRGAKRKFSKGNLVEILFIKLLVQYGLSHEKIRSISEMLHLKIFGDLMRKRGQIDLRNRKKEYKKFREKNKCWASHFLKDKDFKKNRVFILIHNANKKSPEALIDFRSLDEVKPTFDLIRGAESILVIDLTKLFRKIKGL